MRNSLFLNYPVTRHTQRWREALPAGNGTIGIGVYGDIADETILINHGALWWKGRSPELPDVSGKLKEVRALILERKYFEAQSIIKNALLEEGYNPSKSFPLPLGDIKIAMQCEHGFKDYSRVLDMEKGEITVKWTDGDQTFKRKTFVSRVHDIIAIQISSDNTKGINAGFSIGLHDIRDAAVNNETGKPDIPQNITTKVDSNYIYYAAEHDDGTDFGAVAKIYSLGGQCSGKKDEALVKGAEEIIVFVKVFVKGNREKAWKNLKEQLDNIEPDYDGLLECHAKVHSDLFNAASFFIGGEDYKAANEELLLKAYKGEAPKELIEKLWSYGRYLLLSASCKDGLPCSLTGLRLGQYRGMWAFNMANENLQMIYWQAMSGNMPELFLTVVNYYDSMLDDFRANARKLYGCRGIFIDPVSTPGSGLIKTLLPHIIHWTGAAGWIAQHYFDYYLYTNDIEFLKKHAIPFMYEAALFYEDFLVEGKNDCYMSFPSNSPENWPVVENGGGEKLSLHVNSTMDFAIAKELLTNLKYAAELTGIHSEKIPKWEQMLSKIPAYEINEDGAVKEWMHQDMKDNYHHRHQSHLYPVFPGYEITSEESPELFEAFRTAIKKRLIIGLQSQTSWSLCHMACNYARMGEGDLAHECLDLISRSALMNNFFTVHNDWRKMGIGLIMNEAPFQIDANMGWTAAINEMLIFSKPGMIKILPALPSRWSKGTIRGLLCRGAIKADICWDMEKREIIVEFESKEDRKIDIYFPAPLKSAVLKDNAEIKREGNCIKGFSLEKGRTVNIKIILKKINC